MTKDGLPAGSAADLSAHAELWCAVIIQAFIDALSESKKQQMDLDRDSARGWLTGMGKNFRFVCFMAGMDPEEVRRLAVYALHRGIRAKDLWK